MGYVVPPSTIVIENPVAVVDTYAGKHGNQDLAVGFVAWLHTPEAQATFARHGLRTADPGAAPAGLPQPADAFTIRDLGGWSAVKGEVFGAGGAYDQAEPDGE